MNDIDEKLLAILSKLQGWSWSLGKDVIDMSDDGVAEECLVEIKQVFAEAGYITPEQVRKTQELVNQMAQLAQDMAKLPVFVLEVGTMTGQEWYQRLAKHLNSYNWTQDEKDSILQAAFEVAEGLES